MRWVALWALAVPSLLRAAPAFQAPSAPTIFEPIADGFIANPADFHMEVNGYSDPDGNPHASTDWEIWKTSISQRIWSALGATGPFDYVHIHLADGIFENSYAGRTELEFSTDYLLKVRFRDSTGETGPYAQRTFKTSAAGPPGVPGPNPWVIKQAGYVVEVVASGFQLPVNIAFLPNPGSQPTDPLFYVTELYGTIKLVRRNGAVSVYASNLLNFNPTGAFPGSGEQGLTGIVVEPASGDVIASLLYEDTADATRPHYPKILRFHSNDGGLTAATQTTILDMFGETQGQSHQISNLSFSPDGKLFVHMGDGFDTSKGQDINSFRGKVLRMNLDGSAPSDNPFYNNTNGITATDYIYALGLRNPFGGGWRAADGSHWEVENGPTVDRFAKIVAGRNFLYDGTDASMSKFATYNWPSAHGPVNLVFIQPSTFSGSGFPFEKMDHCFATESGPTYATGPQSAGKRIVEFTVDNSGALTSGPATLIEYNGTGKASAVGLAAGPDGLYFTDLYKDQNYTTPIDAGAQILRVRYAATPPTAAPVISPNGGSFGGPVTVGMTSATSGASIRYTIDGSTPTPNNGTFYTGPFTLSVSATVQAISYMNGAQNSMPVPATFTIAGSGPGMGLEGDYFSDQLTSFAFTRTDPTVNFDWGDFGPDPLVGVDGFSARWTGKVMPEFSQTYTFTTASDDGVRLWVNGVQIINDWNNHGTTLNSGTIALVGGQKYDIKLEYFEGGGGAVMKLMWSSPSQPQQIIPQNRLFLPTSGPTPVATPTITPNGGNFTGSVSVSLATATAGATIRYTTDGTNPTPSVGAIYGGPFSLTTSATVKAIAYLAGMPDSAVAVATFTSGPAVVATPTISPNGGTFSGPVTVTLSTTTAGASMRYTTDGSTPSSSAGTLYGGAFAVSTSATVKAIAFNAGMADSAVASAAFSINPAGAGTGLQGEYYDNDDFTLFKFTRVDPTVDFDWGAGSPDPSIGPDLFSVRWTGKVQPQYSETYTFTTASDDGVRLWVNGVQLVNNWTWHGTTLNSGTIALVGGQQYDIKMEYFEGGGGAVAKLFWSSPSQPQQIIPQNRLFPPGSAPAAVATPTISPNGGSFTGSVSVTLATTTGGATIRYTTDGSTPSSSVGTVYAGPFSLTTNATVKAIAVAAGLTDSAVATASFTVSPAVVATPTISPNGGSFTGSVSVTLATTTGGATIRYTTDGSTPSSSVGTVYAGAFTLTTNTTVKAIAYAAGMTDSGLATASFTVGPAVAATPTISPNGGSFTGSVSVALSTTTAGASIRYTTNGTTPSSSVGTLYAGPFSLSTNATVKAIAYAAGMTDSTVASAVFTVTPAVVATPTITPNGGSFTSPVSVTLATATAGASLRYTTDGTTPSSIAGTAYAGPFTLNASATVKAIAYNAGMTDSAVASAVFTIGPAGTGTGLQGDYYDNDDFTIFKLTRIDPTVDFNWGNGSPDPSIGPDLFSVRWTGKVMPQYTETYTFTTTSDDGVRLWVNGVQVINNWTSHGSKSDSGTIALVAGQQYDIKLEYFEGGGGAVIRLFWSSPSQAQQIIPQSRLFPPGGGPPVVASPTITPNGGSFTGSVSVTLATTTGGATIRYTTDGTTPTSSAGTIYTAPFSLTTGATVRAIAYAAGMTDSAVSTATFVVGPAVTATPTISPNGGSFTGSVSVTLATTTGGATIRYTTNGSTPTSSVGTIYAGPFSLTTSATVKAIAYAAGMNDSSVASAAFTVTPPVVATPTITPNGATSTSPVSVTLATATAGATIRYTTDGSTPTSSVGTIYAGPFTLSTSATVKAMAYNAGMTDSAVASAVFTIGPAGTGTGLKGEYYDNEDFTNFKFTRIDPTVDFNWGAGSPDPSIGPDLFSVRWTGKVMPQYTETYTFTTSSDDGVRLWVNGVQVVNNWTWHGTTLNSGTIALVGGQQYDLKLEYFEGGQGAVIRLFWSSPSQPQQIIPQSRLYPPAAPKFSLFGTVQELIDAAAPGDTVQLEAMRYFVPEGVVLKSGVSLRGVSPRETILDGQGAAVVLSLLGSGTVERLAVTGGVTGIEGTGVLRNVVVARNSGTGIVAGSVDGANLTVADNGGAAISVSAAGVFRNLIVSGAIAGPATVTYSTVNGTVAFLDPAALDYREAAGASSVDAGDPADAFDLEPSPNGGRINQGAFGNTADATPTQVPGKPSGGGGGSTGCGLLGLEALLLLAFARRR
jgi:glucose/arabinose dehydrogenase